MGFKTMGTVPEFVFFLIFNHINHFLSSFRREYNLFSDDITIGSVVFKQRSDLCYGLFTRLFNIESEIFMTRQQNRVSFFQILCQAFICVLRKNG